MSTATPKTSGLIRPLTSEFDDYLHDESRSRGEAQTISFPTTAAEVADVLRELHPAGTPIYVQGARTGLAAGAVPHGGHVMNLSRMARYLGLRQDAEGRFFLSVQPGVVLSELRKHLGAKDIPSDGWDEASLAALEALRAAPEQMFPTDPTESSATLGGMAACNASGARSFRYGPMRPHVTALSLVLADGDMLRLRRGDVRARGRRLALPLASGATLELDLPTYRMPACKNASGYFAEDDMDAIDLIIGSDGTLGVIVELEIALMPVPPVIWGVSCFFDSEPRAIDATEALRGAIADAAAIEYFDGAALEILSRQRRESTAFSSLVEPPATAASCVYIEIHAADEASATSDLAAIARVLAGVGASAGATWVARTDVDRESLQFFRHAVPESVNMLIDERRRTEPAITKLGSDMAVPNGRLHDVVALYRRTLAEEGLESAAWGHIGDNHLHVNVLPRTLDDYDRGKRLFKRWAAEVTAMGGAVSAEHGVGKLKRDFLATMYGPAHIAETARVKLAFDPKGQLGRGNLFDASYLDGAGRDRARQSGGLPGAVGFKGGDRA